MAGGCGGEFVEMLEEEVGKKAVAGPKSDFMELNENALDASCAIPAAGSP